MILFAFGRIAQVFLALATMRLATTFLSPEEMGRMTLILAVTSIYSLFFVSPTGMFITRRLHSWYESGKLPHYLIYHFIFLIFVSILAAVTILIFFDLSSLTIDVQIGWLIALVCSSLLVTTSSQTLVSAINILGYRNLFVWLSLLAGCASLIVSVYLVIAIGKEAYIWILGIIIGQAMGGIFGLSALINKGLLRTASKKGLFGIHKNSLKLIPSFIEFIWPLTIALGLAWVQNQWYRFAFEDALGIYALGLFVTGFGISAGIIGAMESALTTYLLPNMYKKINGATQEVWIRAWAEYAAIVYSIIFLLLIYISFLATELTQILVGPMYQSAAKYVAYGAAFEFFRVLSGIIALVAQAKMKTRTLLWPGLIGATTSLGLILLLLPPFGEWGVVIGLVSSGLFASISSAFFILDKRVILLALAGVPRLLLMVAALLVSILLFKSIQFPFNSMISSIIVVGCSGGMMLIVLYFSLLKRVRFFSE
ncbi:hypothetical protein G6713_01695 [Polynucleobacter paneuropaeus]|nr:hypothetical protein G6713_01695 [Polynucleobacter paneuropaeus]